MLNPRDGGWGMGTVADPETLERGAKKHEI